MLRSVRSRRLAAGLLAPFFALVLVSAVSAEVPTPTIEGPITGPGSIFLQSTSFDLGQVGYMEEEYFISGTASAYTTTAPLGLDGRWSVTPGDTAPYKTRIVVRRPIDAQKFNGTVVLEWLNVTLGLDAAVDWTFAHTELIRDGFAWVGVSAQYAGVEGGGGIVSGAGQPLKTVNPGRYGSLSHPGDSFSYDMFSQAVLAIRAQSGPNVLGDLKRERVIATGDSQAAFRLVTYIDAIHPIAQVYDGYLVHSRGVIGAPLSEAPEPAITVPGSAMIRSDLDVPVLALETETDLTSPLVGYFGARQSDSDRFRLWETAGAAHLDAYLLLTGGADLGDSPDIVDLVVTKAPMPGTIACGVPINSGPHHFVLNAAFAALDRWVRLGEAPEPAPRLEVAAGPPVAIVRDTNGNALGGIRTPQVDVPIAAFTGEQSGDFLCILAGTTTPFDRAMLAQLYPSHTAFVSAYGQSLKRAVRAGWILEPDAKLMRAWAARSGPGARCDAQLRLLLGDHDATLAREPAIADVPSRALGTRQPGERCGLVTTRRRPH